MSSCSVRPCSAAPPLQPRQEPPPEQRVVVKIRPSPFYLSLCLHVRGIAHRSEFRRPAPLLAVVRPVPALCDHADLAIAFSMVPSSFQPQTRSESQPGRPFWPTPATPPSHTAACLAAGSSAPPPARPKPPQPSDLDRVARIRSKPSQTNKIPASHGVFAKEPSTFSEINPRSRPIQN